MIAYVSKPTFRIRSKDVSDGLGLQPLTGNALISEPAPELIV